LAFAWALRSWRFKSAQPEFTDFANVAGLSLPRGKPKIGIGCSYGMATRRAIQDDRFYILGREAPCPVRGGPRFSTAAGLVLLLLLLPVFARAESYTVQKGETLYRISRKFDIPVAVLQRFNDISDPSQLRVGTQIRLPECHTVQKGDTLYGIARSYKLNLTDLMRLNGIRDGDTLRAGQVVYVPASGPPRVAVPGSGQGPDTGADSAGKPSGEAVGGDALLWPVAGRREALSGRISGTAIYGSAGQAVVSVSSGRVVWAGPYRGFNRVVLIEAKNGYTYVYAGNDETLVAVGDTVEPGAEIGRLGTSAHQGVPQLYFLVYRNGEPVDPARAPRS
jgi:murein DD-endopeptidase MepM/ murein hydrolase activator NlpD